MIEILILYKLNKKVLTMYGVSKEIKKSFSVLTTPSYGTIKPALRRLEAKNFVKTQKTMSEGGRPSTYYSITKEGTEELKRLITCQPQENPVMFLTTARIKLACADLLSEEEFDLMIKQLQFKAENILLDTQSLLKEYEADFYLKMVFDNLTCEYGNFLSLLKGLEHAGAR